MESKTPKEGLSMKKKGFTEVMDNIGKVFSHSEVKYKVTIEDTTISNGLGFSQDGLSHYFIDTPTKKVAKFAYVKEIGDVSFESYMIEFNGDVSPDDMCMDNEGLLCISAYGEGRILRWNPENGRKMDERKLTYPNVASRCLDRHLNLYITNTKSFDKNEMYGGGLFYVELN